MIEKFVEKNICKYLKNNGWNVYTGSKHAGEHGVDIHARHPKWHKLLFIETKGGSGKHKHQELHNAFYNMLGQILSRMNKEGNNPKKARIYAIGIPYAWLQIYKNKISKMKYGWKLLKLRTYVVKASGQVIELPYSRMLMKR